MSLNITKLRTDPKGVCDEYGFIVKSPVVKSDEGGSCKLSLKKLDGNVYQLEPTYGAGSDYPDWFFPYRHDVGTCRVPIPQPEGTIALTGGMNGCTLEVYKNGGYFYFYHDNNGCHLHKSGAPAVPGEQVCCVPYRSYAGLLNLGFKQAETLTKAKKMPVDFQHTLICVRTGGGWKVYVTGVHTYGITGKYSIFRPTITCLLTSFADE